MKNVVLMGYSGHAYVVADTLLAMGLDLLGYFEQFQKEVNPFNLPYLGWEREEESLKILSREKDLFFTCMGNNKIRARISENLLGLGYKTLVALHPSAVVSNYASVGHGTFLAAGCKVNALAKVGKGVILNTGCIVEHECIIDDYAHIAPGAVLAGNVSVGESSFIGANAVIKEGVYIGKNVTIGAGAVVLKDVPDHQTWVGNPARKLEKHAR